MKRIRIVARLLLAATFVFSSLTKALDPEGFAVQVAAYGVSTAPGFVHMVAWGAIAIEMLFGFLLATAISLRGLVHAAVIVLLVFFSGMIAYGWAFRGLEDCGCFGTIIKTSPSVSLAKNAALIFLAGLTWPRGTGKAPLSIRQEISMMARSPWRLGVSGSMILTLVATLAYGQRSNGASDEESSARQETADPDPDRPFAVYSFEFDGEWINLGEGTYFVAMLSTTCDHCKDAVAELNELPLFYPDFPPIVALCLGDEPTLTEFRNETRPDFPIRLIPPLDFFGIVDGAPPSFVLVSEGRGMQNWTGTLPSEAESASIVDGPK